MIRTLSILLGILFASMLFSSTATAQTYSVSGKLVDANDSTIYTASIILTNQADSSFVQGTVSDLNGNFTLNDVKEGKYILFIQHLLYAKKSISADVSKNLQLGNIALSEKENELDEISVKATRPVVKMVNNVLSYDATAVSEKFVRDNAMEVLGDVPGVFLKDESVELLGVSKLNIAINGKPTTLSMSQVLNMLKAMPNTNVKEIQVMYAPPAKYNVKGALINIILNKANVNEINGSVNAGFRQRRNSGALGGFNLQYAKEKWNFNLLYSFDYDHRNSINGIDINHTYKDTLYQIEQDMENQNESQIHQVQFSTDYQIDTLQTLSFSYSGNLGDDSGGPTTTDASFTSVKGVTTELDTSFSHSDETLHNLKLDYSLTEKLNIGAEYTYYKSPSTDDYTSIVNGEATDFRTKSSQTVNKWMMYANHSFNLWNTDFSYGANVSYSGNENYYTYYNCANGQYTVDQSQSTVNDFNEQAYSGFVSFSKQLTPKFLLNFSLKGEFDRMQKDSSGTKNDIWNTFYWYPTMNASYTADAQANHIFQLSVKSYTTYPSYWEISPATWYSNQYMLVQGNPELKPSQTYTASLNYIFKRKYVLVLSFESNNDDITQIPFASSDRFNTIAKNENIDYNRQTTVALVLPFNLGKYININPTAIYLHQHLKNSTSEDKAFDRKADIFVLQCNSAVSLWKAKGLKATLSGHYYGRGIQGIYDFEPSCLVDCGVSCNMLKNKAVLSLKVNDVFSSSIPKLNIDYKNQKSHYDLDQDTRMFTVTFRYNFGKPIKAKKIDVDDSRFRRMN